MSFKLSRRSLDRLEGIDDRLQAVVKMAITMTKTDFGVVQGMRTLEQQKELVDKGASQTMKSKHLEGKAFDIMAYINGRASWELSVYDDLADAIKEAATQMNVPICWGAAWGTPAARYSGLPCHPVMLRGQEPILCDPVSCVAVRKRAPVCIT